MPQIFYLICTGSISASECKLWLNHTNAAEIWFSFTWLHCQLHISREEKWHFNGDPRWHLLCAVTSAEREWSITLGCFHLCQSLCQSVTEEHFYTKAFFFFFTAGQQAEVITELHNYSTIVAVVLHGLLDGTFCSYHGGRRVLVHQRLHTEELWYARKLLRGRGFCPVPSQHGFGLNRLNKQLWSQLAELSNGICPKCERLLFPTCQLWKMNFHMLHICH